MCDCWCGTNDHYCAPRAIAALIMADPDVEVAERGKTFTFNMKQTTLLLETVRDRMQAAREPGAQWKSVADLKPFVPALGLAGSRLPWELVALFFAQGVLSSIY